MESIGAKLQGLREEQGLSVEQVARDTHITRRYIEALESEDFDTFPGESYLLGFLRTYAEYLGLDSQEIVNLYRNIKLQEQPPPIDELIVRRRSGPVVLTVFLILLIGGVAFGLYYLIDTGVIRFSRPDAGTELVVPTASVYAFESGILERRFQQNDAVEIPVHDVTYTVTFARIEDAVTIETSYGSHAIDERSEMVVDVNNDGRGDIRVLVREIVRGAEPPAVVVRFDRTIESPVGVGVPESADPDPVPEAVGATNRPDRVRDTVVLFESQARGPVPVSLRFDAPAMFRYETDGEGRSEAYYESGQTASAVFEESIRFWVTNAGSVTMQVQRPDRTDAAVSLGAPGAATAGFLTWAESDRVQRLELRPMY